MGADSPRPDFQASGTRPSVSQALSFPLLKTNTEADSPKKGRKIQLPSPDWRPSDETIAWAKETYPPHANGKTLSAFRDYHLARGTSFVSWDRAFRNWVRKEADFATAKVERGPSRTYL